MLFDLRESSTIYIAFLQDFLNSCDHVSLVNRFNIAARHKAGSTVKLPYLGWFFQRPPVLVWLQGHPKVWGARSRRT
ncbi:hypothetical protein M405DRAFT_214037 [Rhizopogon salebrosus TDB-379]|nr:hypothetical protein M405DRAFT_214037 [Rhizopogon salebrosus TDB-379]